MFIERLTDEEAIEIAKRYLMIHDEEKDVTDPSYYINKNTMERGGDYISFDFEIYLHESEWVCLKDFSLGVTLGSTNLSRKTNLDYQRSMYRRFGKEYLDALDEYYRRPIEDDYNEKMDKHNKMLSGVKGEIDYMP